MPGACFLRRQGASLKAILELAQSYLPIFIFCCHWIAKIASLGQLRRKPMFKGGFRPATFVLIALAGVCTGQQHSSGVQSPRQAIIEMVSGGEAAFKKHLTLEMQDKLQDLMKPSVNGAPNPLQVLMSTKSGSDNFQAFDIGPILFSFNNPQQHERYEVQLDSEEPRGDEDVMKLSLHLVRNGIEHEMPVGFQFVTNMKRQENIWRLNTVTFSATLPVGDPRILDKSWWN